MSKARRRQYWRGNEPYKTKQHYRSGRFFGVDTYDPRLNPPILDIPLVPAGLPEGIPGTVPIPDPANEEQPKVPRRVTNGNVTAHRFLAGKTTGLRYLFALPDGFVEGSRDIGGRLYFTINGTPLVGETLKLILRFFVHDPGTDLSTEAHTIELVESLSHLLFPTDQGIFKHDVTVPGAVFIPPLAILLKPGQQILMDLYRSRIDTFPSAWDFTQPRLALVDSAGPLGFGGGPTT